jgi:hypothetical protein
MARMGFRTASQVDWEPPRPLCQARLKIARSEREIGHEMLDFGEAAAEHNVGSSPQGSLAAGLWADERGSTTPRPTLTDPAVGSAEYPVCAVLFAPRGRCFEWLSVLSWCSSILSV